MNHRTKLLQGAIKLAARSDSYSWQAKLHAHQTEAKKLLWRSHLQALGAIRLLALADEHRQS